MSSMATELYRYRAANSIFIYHQCCRGLGLKCFANSFPSPAGSNCPFCVHFCVIYGVNDAKMSTKKDNLNRPDSES
jgi:hypothetical protein